MYCVDVYIVCLCILCVCVYCVNNSLTVCVCVLQLKAENTSVILSNTYHLLLQPGPDVVQKLGKRQ